MADLREVAASSARGTFILTIGRFTSLVISALGMILVARMLSPSEYGLYGLSLVIPSAFMLFNDWGVNQGLVKFLAQYRSENEDEKVLRIGLSGLVFKILLGGLLSILLFLGAGFLATRFQGRPELGVYIRLVSLISLFQTLHGAGFSILVGFEKMDGRAVMDMIQGLVKGIVSPLLVWQGFGISGALFGHLLSFFGSSVLGLFLILENFGTFGKIQLSEIRLGSNVFDLIGYGFPLFIGGFIGGSVNWFRGLLMSWYIADDVVGNYIVASRFTSLIGVFTASIGTSLFPAFSKFSFEDDEDKLRGAYENSVSYTSLFVIPLVVYVIAFSEPALEILFGDKYSYASLILKLLLIPVLMVGFGSVSNVNIFNSQGETGASMRVSGFRSIVLALLSAVLVWYYGILGYVVSLVIANLSGVLFSLFLLNKSYHLAPRFDHSAKVYVVSFISAGISYFVSQRLEYNIVSLLVGGLVFVVFYLILSPLIGTLILRDINNLDLIFKDFRIIYPIVRIILDVERFIIKTVKG